MRKFALIFLLVCTPALFAQETPVMNEQDTAEDTVKTAEVKCRQWAEEDGVVAEEMENYIRDCVKDLSGADEG